MQQFTHRITEFPDGDKSFIHIPFKVDENVERIEVSYLFPAGSAGSVIDLGLARNGVPRGATGSEYGHIFVTSDRAAPGYHAGPLPGDWDVILGIVKVGPECFVDLTIRLIPKTAVWLAGELHSHTEHSDGGVLVHEAIHRARGSGCDFVALTDHNTTAQNQIQPDDPTILVIPGMELTSYWGHTNFLGLDEPVADWRCYGPEDVVEKMSEAKERGATVVINHPFQRSAGGKWQSGFDGPFDAFEIWNGNWALHNIDALVFWQELLVQGRKVPCVGGSDFHLKNRRRHGRPANRLYSDSTSIEGILAAIRRGSNVVCSAPDETHVVPSSGTPMFGEEVNAGQAVGLEFSGLAKGDDIHLVSEAGVFETIPATTSQQEIEVAVNGRFLRCEVWREDQPRAFTNPFYAA